MNKISIYLFVLLSLSCGNLFAQECDYSDDFATLGIYTSFNDPIVTTAQWQLTGCNHPNKSSNITLGGRSDLTGYVVSPVFPEGCSSISFEYNKVNESNENGSGAISFKVELLQSGVTVWEDEETELSFTNNTTYEPFSKSIAGVSGAFQLKITNTSNGNNTNTSARNPLRIQSICITKGEPQEGLSVAITGVANPAGGFFDEATVTLSSTTTDASICYTVDETEPTAESTAYVEPLTITETTRIRAIAVLDETVSEMLDTLIVITPSVPPYTCQFNVPKDATVYVGDKDQAVEVLGNYLKVHYIPFTKKDNVFTSETDTSRIWYYNLPTNSNYAGGYSYRIARAGKAPHVGLFRIDKNPELVFTSDMLDMHDVKAIDHDVNSLNGRNVADVFININAQGYLTLPLRNDTAFQLIHTRNWQAIDGDCNNYFIEPDFHYTVVDENGAPSSDVIIVSDSGVIRPVGAGTAIVLVDYDAMVCHHPNAGSCSPGVYGINPSPYLYSALWGENTAAFVVSVNPPEAHIITNMNLNDYWAQDGTAKTAGIAIDAEHDVMYFEAEKGSFPYTFTPAGVERMLVATPTVGATTASYNGFRTDSVTENGDGSYTVKLGFGRNIVKLVSETDSTYQVITAKPVTYTVSNITHPGEAFVPGDSVSVLFNTLYHPANKMSGIYNMSAGIQYSNDFTNFPLFLGPGQYTFASRAQRYGIRIPDTFAEEEFVLDKGVIKTNGFGSLYGAHREITIQNGVPPNLSASVREAYLGSIPDIHIPIPSNHTGISAVTTNNISVSPNPFTDYIVVNATENGTAQLFDILGKIVSTSALQSGKNHISTSTLPAGIYVLKVGKNTVKLRRM